MSGVSASFRVKRFRLKSPRDSARGLRKALKGWTHTPPFSATTLQTNAMSDKKRAFDDTGEPSSNKKLKRSAYSSPIFVVLMLNS